MSNREDQVREDRIANEITVDCCDEQECALSWYYYLEEHLHMPFRARCLIARAISPLWEGEAVEVIGMPPEEDCRHEIFVLIRWKGRTFGVPLSQLEGVDADEETQEAIEDWHYWVKTGCEF